LDKIVKFCFQYTELLKFESSSEDVGAGHPENESGSSFILWGHFSGPWKMMDNLFILEEIRKLNISKYERDLRENLEVYQEFENENIDDLFTPKGIGLIMLSRKSGYVDHFNSRSSGRVIWGMSEFEETFGPGPSDEIVGLFRIINSGIFLSTLNGDRAYYEIFNNFQECIIFAIVHDDLDRFSFCFSAMDEWMNSELLFDNGGEEFAPRWMPSLQNLVD